MSTRWFFSPTVSGGARHRGGAPAASKEFQRERYTYLAQKPENLEIAAVYLEAGRPREAVEAVPKGVEEVEEDLRHRGGARRIRALYLGFGVRRHRG